MAIFTMEKSIEHVLLVKPDAVKSIINGIICISIWSKVSTKWTKLLIKILRNYYKHQYCRPKQFIKHYYKLYKLSNHTVQKQLLGLVLDVNVLYY